MNKFICLMILGLLCLSVNAQQTHTVDMGKIAEHPRLLMFKGEEKMVRKLIASDDCWQKMHQSIISTSDELISTPLPERKMIGKRLLDVSRLALRNIFFLSYSYRMTGESKYVDRAEAEMLAISDFSDWNPSHFLDVGEMTMAMAIGYDWMYDQLKPASRKKIRDAIIAKGIRESTLDENSGFVQSKSNWNQVCNAGITYGALAVAEDEPLLAKSMIERAVNSIYMEEYAPDGVYPEGSNYWSYGTSFNVMFLSAIDKVFSTDFGLSGKNNFNKTASYIMHMAAPDGKYFNYSDASSSSKAGLNISLFWFANKYNDMSILHLQKKVLAAKEYNYKGNRLLPALMIWANGIDMSKVTAPEQKMFTGQGKAPVSLMRTSWSDPNAIFVGYKLGSPWVSHAHMDIGSFVMVADGVRWASDLGMQEYESLESKGIDLWNKEQNSQRWQVFRYNNMAHNTLTFDGQLQSVKGYAKLDKTRQDEKFMLAISDLTDLYKGQISAVKRGVAIVDNSYVVVRDEIETLSKETNIRWNMLTGATVTLQSDNSALLSTKGGKKLLLRVDSPAGAKVRTWSTAPTNSWDTPNGKTMFVGFEYNAQGQSSVTLQVSLIPCSDNNGEASFNTPLASW